MKIIALLLSLFCLSCTAGDVDEQTAFALEAVQDNLLTTDLSALIEITGNSVEELPSSEGEALLAIHYRARILETFLGDPPESIQYTAYQEKSEGLENLSEGRLIVSLCREPDGSYYLADIGYELPPDGALIKKAREIGRLINAKKLSLQRGDDYACRSNQ
jgi:hypothetical protein